MDSDKKLENDKMPNSLKLTEKKPIKLTRRVKEKITLIVKRGNGLLKKALPFIKPSIKGFRNIMNFYLLYSVSRSLIDIKGDTCRMAERINETITIECDGTLWSESDKQENDQAQRHGVQILRQRVNQNKLTDTELTS